MTGHAVVYDNKGTGTNVGGLLVGEVYWVHVAGSAATLHHTSDQAVSGAAPIALSDSTQAAGHFLEVVASRTRRA